MMNILCVGGSGFIGSNLIEQIKKDKKEEDSLVSIDIRDALSFDARSIKQMEHYTKGTDIVFHCGNIPAHRLSMSDPYTIIENNYNATLAVAEACRKTDCHKIVFLSSFAVYGDHGCPWDEETPVKATTPYGLGKIQSEMLLYAYHKWYGLDMIVIRPSNVFGENEELHKPWQVIPSWLLAHKYNTHLEVAGSETTRDFTYVQDVVRGILLASRKNGYEVYNLCNGVPVKLVDVARMISDNIQIVDLPAYETEQWWGSCDKAKKELGFKITKDIWEWVDERKRADNKADA
jgi:nucleoside-diphosphate-sugar epimerase